MFSNESLSERNGESATITMKDWLIFLFMTLVNFIPVVGFVLFIILMCLLAFRRSVAPTIRNLARATLILLMILAPLYYVVLFFFGDVIKRLAA